MHSHNSVSPDRALKDQLLNLAPGDQPNTVHEMAERLLPAYTVEGGTVHLAGCLLDDQLFLRVSARQADRSTVFFLDDKGSKVDPVMVNSLGMNHTVSLDRPPEQAEEAIRRLSQVAREVLALWFGDEDLPRAIEFAPVWCKFAKGKLRFVIGENSVDLSFADWARTLKPPPFVCPHTNHATYHLTVIDDGRIVPVEQVATCQQSRQRVLASELTTCTATGRQVLPKFTETCPVTGQIVLQQEMIPCGICRQKVVPSALRQGHCEACGRLETVSKADPRLARLLGEHPLLDRWRHWCLSESSSAYHLTARGWLRKLLLIVDKDSLDLMLLATGHRFRSGWDVVDRSQYEFVLRG